MADISRIYKYKEMQNYMVEIDAILSPEEKLPETDSWLVVDLFRATSNIVHFFHLGGKALIPVEDVQEAGELKKRNGKDWLLMGERKALPPLGFDFGNSPLEYSRELLERKPFAVLTTTNGTRAALRAEKTGAPVYAACARNATAAVEKALAAGRRICLLCAGSEGRVALEDVVCCGLLADIVKRETGSCVMSDGALVALALWEGCSGDLSAGVEEAEHCGILKELGFGRDVDFCCETDRTEVVPWLLSRSKYPVFVPCQLDSYTYNSIDIHDS